jgi:hypothetical protein
VRRDVSESNGAGMRQDAWEPGSAGEPWSGSWPAARHAARLRLRARRGWRQLGFRRQFVAILMAAAVVSAVGTVMLAAVWMPPVRHEVGLLLLIGLALTALCLFVGYRLSGPVSRRAYTALTGGLDAIAGSAVRMEALAVDQTTRSRQQALLARQLSDEVRALGEAAERLEQGVALLRDTAGQMWAEMSYPTSAVDTPISARSARQAAITASQLGAAIEQTTSLCYRLRARTNLVIAEADLLSAQGREAEHQLGALREGVRRVEEALGGSGSLPVPGHARTASEQVNAALRPSWRLLRALAGTLARWGAPRWPRDRGGARAASAYGSRRLPTATTGGVAARNGANTTSAHGTPIRGAGGSRLSSGRHPAAGGHPRPGASTARGRMPSRPRLPDTAPHPTIGAGGGRGGAPDQPPFPPRSTPHPGDEWLNGADSAR